MIRAIQHIENAIRIFESLFQYIANKRARQKINNC